MTYCKIHIQKSKRQVITILANLISWYKYIVDVIYIGKEPRYNDVNIYLMLATLEKNPLKWCKYIVGVSYTGKEPVKMM